MVKRLYTKTKSDCLNDIAAVVEQSSNVNMAQIKKGAGRYPIAHTCGGRRLCYQPHTRQVMTAIHSYVLGIYIFDMDSGEAERYASFINDVFGGLAAALEKGSETETTWCVRALFHKFNDRQKWHKCLCR